MAKPLLPGYHFNVEHKVKASNYTMPSMDIYRDYHSFGYMLTGNRIIITPSKTVYVHPGTIAFIHKDMPHRTTFASDVNYENFGIKFKPHVLQKFAEIMGQSILDEWFEQITVEVAPDAEQKIKELLVEIEDAWNHYSSHTNFLIECLFNQILILIATNRSTKPAEQNNLSEKHKILFDATHYLEQNFQADPSLETTARAIHVSASYLSRLFSSELGSSYSAFLVYMKINYAQKLLITTQLSVSDIAVRSGFKNNSYFSDIFKKKVGTSPLRFKKEYLQSNNNT